MRCRPPCLIIASLILIAGFLAAGESDYVLEKVTLEKKEDSYYVAVSYRGVFPLKVLSAIEDGIRVRIVCEVFVRRRSGFALSRDEELYSAEYARTVQYNLMDGRYLIINQNTGTIRRASRRGQLLKMLSAPESLPVVGVRNFGPNGQYYAEARIAIRFGKLYPPFSFLSIMTYESPWVRSEVLLQ